ncbi:MAG: AbrB/MazE/SpoVT family DNA-binding domain-containing protein [Terriglobales bacterium]
MPEVTMSSKNQIVIPREAREALDLKPGDKLVVSTVGGRIIIMERPKSYRAALAGIARGLYPKEYLKKERNSWR